MEQQKEDRDWDCDLSFTALRLLKKLMWCVENQVEHFLHHTKHLCACNIIPKNKAKATQGNKTMFRRGFENSPHETWQNVSTFAEKNGENCSVLIVLYLYYILIVNVYFKLSFSIRVSALSTIEMCTWASPKCPTSWKQFTFSGDLPLHYCFKLITKQFSSKDN